MGKLKIDLSQAFAGQKVGVKQIKDRIDRLRRSRALSEPDEDMRMREALVEREESLRQARIRFNAWLTARNRPILPLRRGEYVDHLRPIVLLASQGGGRGSRAGSSRPGARPPRKRSVPGGQVSGSGLTKPRSWRGFALLDSPQ